MGDRVEHGFLLDVFNNDGLTTVEQVPAVGGLIQVEADAGR